MYSTICLVVLSLFFSPGSCAECPVPGPLGMESGAILDSQITASSAYDAKHGAVNGRLNLAATSSRTGGWAAQTIDVNQWLQVDMNGQAEISEIQTQGRDCCGQYVTTFKVSYSNDGSTFTDYAPSGSAAKVFTGNSDAAGTVVANVLSPIIKARYIRVHPLSWNAHISMRVELIGCRTEMDSNSCAGMRIGGYCHHPYFQAHCPSNCPTSCSNYMPDAGCAFVKQTGGCKDLFTLCRKTCKKCDVKYGSLGCFIDQNGDRIMNTLLHRDYAEPNIVSVCAQKASARGYSVFGVEATGECFSGPDAELTFSKHGQAALGDCINGAGASFRMSVYKFY